MKKLQLTFKTAEGHKKDLVFNYVREDLDAPTVKKAMDEIIASKLFEKNSVQLYTEVVAAKYVERVETGILEKDLAI
ncbi:DUF2922 domain-containing protein [Companilactobacillus allii]|uniref:DUF2922 domain-containing protein n=1 Tax=Companilactobacillus allii TaxID=1847728 RepID=A0A1P8Q208_9LACO|nr:DUF2922 domain-containing protein [Companilactobacillus allii]APX71912.1 hypothetical protein BTM29_04785 [Companilactobacillus allii]USQ69005.1 DUF2922 domain-containing protein [Companilactobacillus allii]